MKRYCKSLLSLIMSVLMLFSVCIPAFASYTPEMPEIEVYTLMPDGEVSESGYQAQKIVDENGKEVIIKSASSNKKPVANKAPSIPYSYSSEDLGYCSEIKNQGGTNSCWAFSSVAAAETTLLRKGLVSKSSELSDLSEAHLVWFAHKSLTTDVSDPTFGDGTNVGSPYSSGGDWHRSTFTLARGVGYALEKDYPFYPYNAASMGNYDESKRYDSKVTLDEAYIIPEENTNEIKTAIMEYGSVSVAGLIVMEYLNGFAYYQNKYVGTNHQMIIVGWDDKFSVKNFKADCRPASDGAWLVKNSYDTTWGDNGYFWISYEDPSLTDFLVQDVSIKNDNETTYQYDGFGYHSLLSIPNYYDGAVANVFTAQKNEAIESVAFYTAQENVTYEISVYKNVTKGADNPVEDGDKFSTVTEGFAKYQGYHKIKLDKVVPVSKGEIFSVVVRMSVPESDGNRIIIPVEGTSETTDGYYSRFYSSEPGQSFFTLSDLAWSPPEISDNAGNITSYNNVCVKAFTVPDNTFKITTAEEFNDFALRVANGESFEGKNINLACDIDFNGGEIIPVGTEKFPFKGYFLGNGFVLKNGVINSDSDYVGVFSVIPENAQISKLGIEDISVTGAYGVGALCGYNEGKIIHCYATGSVQGEESVGGLVGINAGEISHSYSTCDVSGDDSVGSFIGENDSGTDTNCYVIMSDLDLIGNDYGEVMPLESEYFSNGFVAFFLDEGKSSHRKNVWTKRDGKTTFLKSPDETVYEVELFDKSTNKSIYLYVNANDNLKELAEQQKEGMIVTIYADPHHRVLYESVPISNMILYVEWKTSHICADNLELIPGIDADCYTGGNKPYYRCSCGKLYKDGKATELTDEVWITINPLNHPAEDVVKTERVEPTHTTDGNMEYYTCLICGDIFEDSHCTIKAKETILPASGHSYSDWVTEINPGCETEGIEVKICSCGDRVEKKVPATGHTVGDLTVENRKEPDCINNGSYDLVICCLICEKVLSRETVMIQASGHTAGSLVEENKKEPDCTEEGSCDQVLYCSVCGEELLREIVSTPALGHSYKDIVTLPTENEKGYITKACTRCTYSYISEYIDASKKVSISGKVTSYLSDKDTITVEFISYGETEPTYTYSLTGNNTAYFIESIRSGVYTVRISKKNHVTREYENIVIKEGEFDFKICPIGDVNNDGKVSIVDYTAVLRHTKKIGLIEGYAFKCADVVSDGRINVSDYIGILKHVKKTASLWKQ